MFLRKLKVRNIHGNLSELTNFATKFNNKAGI